MFIELFIAAGVILRSTIILDTGYNELSPVESHIPMSSRKKSPRSVLKDKESKERDRLPAEVAIEPIKNTLKAIPGAEPVADNDDFLKKCVFNIRARFNGASSAKKQTDFRSTCAGSFRLVLERAWLSF